MVKAAVDFRYGKDFYKEGDPIPESLVPELEKHQCHVLDTFVDVNGSWHKIDDPRISGWVEQRKHLEKRLRAHFNIKNDTPKEKSNMLTSRTNVVAELNKSKKKSKKEDESKDEIK